MRFLLTLALLPSVSLHAGQTRYFAPGQLRVGEKVTCLGASGRTVGTVPTAGSDSSDFTWGPGRGPQLSVETNTAGAVAVGCGTALAAERLPDVPYLLGRNGLGLIPGTKTLAGIRKLFGGSTRAIGSSCRLSSFSLGFTATFAGTCTAKAAFVAATVTGSRWSSLDGVRIGDSVARMRWQDAAARELSAGVWLLGGEGVRHPPRLLAVVAHGKVARFEIRTR